MGSAEFWEKAGVAAVGPVVAAVLGTLIIGSFLAWIARRQESAREGGQLRHELVSQMTLSANELHFAIMHYIRVESGRIGGGLTLSEMAPVLHEQYRKTRSAGYVLDARLAAYFTTAEPARAWHAAMDFLSLRYYSAIGQASEEILGINAGPGHTGLTVGELATLLSTHADAEKKFRELMQLANNEVMTAPLRRPGAVPS